jgi:hypothetical protein
MSIILHADLLILMDKHNAFISDGTVLIRSRPPSRPSPIRRSRMGEGEMLFTFTWVLVFHPTF